MNKYRAWEALITNVHGDNVVLNLQALKYLFWLFILCVGEPDLLDAITNLVRSWTT